MKKQILILSSLLLPLMGMAQGNVEPKLVPGVYALKMSPNGKWLGSMAGDASLYNMETGENLYYVGNFLGLGNAVANNGMAVGNANDVGTLMYQGKTLTPESIGGENYWFCDINSITPDASRICGLFNNAAGDETMYVPFVADVDANGNVGAPTVLPYPEKDFFDMAPQYVSAVWISNDGKTVIGQVLDWRGKYTYPIYYTEGSNGEWSYTLPSESLFNPTHIEIPESPWLDEPDMPDPVDFMSGTRKDAYEEAYQAAIENGTELPDPTAYMTDEEFVEYGAALATYNKWFYGQEDAIKAYEEVYNKILQTSPSFYDNEMCIQPMGEYMMIRGGLENESGERSSKIYKFGITNTENLVIDTPTASFYPSQILSDGTLIITKPIDEVASSLLMLPGADTFITMQEYFNTSHPEISEWLDENVPGGTGVVLINDDMTLFTGALIPDQLSEDIDKEDFYYSTYIIQLDSAGVEQIMDENFDGVYKVYNLQGVKMVETKDASVVDALPSGIYVINGKKILK